MPVLTSGQHFSGLVYVFVAVAAILSSSRGLALYNGACDAHPSRIVTETRLIEGYHAPLDVYAHLSHVEAANPTALHVVNVCVGKEWHRYPAAFFLPNERRVQSRRFDSPC